MYDQVREELEDKIRRLEEDRHNIDISSGLSCFVVIDQFKVPLLLELTCRGLFNQFADTVFFVFSINFLFVLFIKIEIKA